LGICLNSLRENQIFFCISAKKGEYPQNKKGIIKKNGECFPKTFGDKIKKGVKFRGCDFKKK